MNVLVAVFYGLSVLTSGLVRYFGAPGGDAGLWFGVVMGSIAMAAGALFYNNKMFVGRLMVWTSLFFVGGWFIYEALIKKGFSAAEPRLLIVLGITLLTALFFAAEAAKVNTDDQTDNENSNN